MRALVFGAALCLVGCNLSSGKRCEDMHFDRFSTADRIVITIASKVVGDPIVDKTRIQAVREFVTGRFDGWSAEPMGPPVPRVNADFYQSDKLLGDFGVGQNFASAQGCGYFQTRSLSIAEAREYLRLLGVDEAQLTWK
jgi:hypothetical protein